MPHTTLWLLAHGHRPQWPGEIIGSHVQRRASAFRAGNLHSELGFGGAKRRDHLPRGYTPGELHNWGSRVECRLKHRRLKLENEIDDKITLRPHFRNGL